MRLLIAYCAVPLHCRQTHECLDASAQGGGKDLHVLGSVPEPAGDGPPGAVMSGDRGGVGQGGGGDSRAASLTVLLLLLLLLLSM